MARRPITPLNPYRPTRGVFAGQAFGSERQYREALAHRRGFRSRGEQRRAARLDRLKAEVAALSPARQEQRERALDALALMRRERLPLSPAARKAGTTPRTVRKYAGSALTRGSGGRYRARRSDSLYRRMWIASTDGVLDADIPTSAEAALNARHANAVRKYGETGDASDLAQFEGRTIAGLRLETDLDALDDLLRAGEFDFLDLYEPAA